MRLTLWMLFCRKRGLLLNNLTGVLGAILMGSSKAAMSYEMIIIGRFFIGFNCGKWVFLYESNRDCLRDIFFVFSFKA